jgi:flagellar hook-basal body complex protein FliE
MSVSGIESVGFTPYVAPTVAPTGPTGPAAASSADGQSFGNMVLSGIDHLEGVQDRADQLSVQAATGDLSAIHDYTIAATEASVTTQLTVAMRNKAVEAFTEIMRMPI